jgi:hypothetical protein
VRSSNQYLPVQDPLSRKISKFAWKLGNHGSPRSSPLEDWSESKPWRRVEHALTVDSRFAVSKWVAAVTYGRSIGCVVDRAMSGRAVRRDWELVAKTRATAGAVRPDDVIYPAMVESRSIPQITWGDELSLPGDMGDRRDCPWGFPGNPRDGFTAVG